jgi:hypothetical protein
VLPSIEEGFGLVVTEATGIECLPLISDACTDICKRLEHGWMLFLVTVMVVRCIHSIRSFWKNDTI